MVTISICIPTYNFGKYIGQTLDSILPQISQEIEVIVLDGGSTDDTAKVVGSRQRDYVQLTYYQQSFRGGIDRDIEKVVSLAKGQYCWLFSADDIMLPGAIEKVFQAIKSNNDVYICEHVLCDLDMKPMSEYPPFNNMPNSKLFNLGNALQKKEYFRAARTSEAFFSFMSGPIFKKNIWDKAEIPDSFRDTCWIVAGHLLSMVPKGITVNYTGETLLHKRGGNDSFADRGIVNRYRIAIENFQFVAHAIFGIASEEAFHVRRVLQLDVTLMQLLYAKLKTAEFPFTENIIILNRLAKKHYSDATVTNWIKYAIYKISNPSILKMASKLRKWLQKPNGA
ncbi:MAG: glycosyltransferase family 2 protein [Cytophaga sp.]|nr:glycosyltransferase family 2 protein [Undibacterium sp.]